MNKKTCNECSNRRALSQYLKEGLKCRTCRSKCEHGIRRCYCEYCNGSMRCPHGHLNKHQCPVCNGLVDKLGERGSLGEQRIKNNITNKNIQFKREHRFQDQGEFNIVIARCRYDFYLPNHNIIIEYHGRQHYHYTPHFHRGGIMSFYNSIYRDFIKKIYCYSKGIKFIEIRYDENIEVALSKIT